MIMVHVDDIKMSGPTGNTAQGWSLMKGGLTLDSPGRGGRCHHRVREARVSGKPVRIIECVATDLTASCVEAH